VLLLAFVLLRENRDVQALWILLPVVLFRLLWVGFAALSHMPSATSLLFVSLINCMMIGLALNWLFAHRIGHRNRFATWLLALLVFILISVLTLVNVGFGIEAIQISILIGFTIGILMVSFALAGWICRKKFGPVRFSIWMAVWILFTTTAFIMSFAIIQTMMTSESLTTVLLDILMISLVYAGIVIVGLLPFEILLFANSFWRKRFDSIFRLKTAVVTQSVWTNQVSEPQKPADK